MNEGNWERKEIKEKQEKVKRKGRVGLRSTIVNCTETQFSEAGVAQDFNH
jgi:hypothetical protein